VKRLGRAVIAGLLAATLTGPASAAPSVGAATLRPTFGGVLLEAHLLPRGNTSLTGVWADSGHARLMKCAPRCQVIPAIPLGSPLTVSQDSTYRVVLGGTFKPGQRVKVLLRFDQATLITVEAAVVAR
jgi:hypothetical protein